ncbi:MAG: hypothetical protein LBC92_05665 [Rickettsiales bacterium]|jgi:hypothetical protein|nr:hypothetical protein [Rickettsiales bacterium]
MTDESVRETEHSKENEERKRDEKYMELAAILCNALHNRDSFKLARESNIEKGLSVDESNKNLLSDIKSSLKNSEISQVVGVLAYANSAYCAESGEKDKVLKVILDNTEPQLFDDILEKVAGGISKIAMDLDNSGKIEDPYKGFTKSKDGETISISKGPDASVTLNVKDFCKLGSYLLNISATEISNERSRKAHGVDFNLRYGENEEQRIDRIRRGLDRASKENKNIKQNQPKQSLLDIIINKISDRGRNGMGGRS